MLPKRVWYYGRDEDLPSRRELRAGPISLLFEEGDLRSIRLGEREVIRRIYVAIRDRNWGTVAPLLSNVTQEVGEDSFRISFDVENRRARDPFHLEGLNHGRLARHGHFLHGRHGTLDFLEKPYRLLRSAS